MLEKVGCCGFPIARSRYFAVLPAVEITSSFDRPPKPVTARAWRASAPEGFEFSLLAWKLITHPESLITFDGALRKMPPRRRAFCGNFKPTPEVQGAWEATEQAAGELRARFIVFETPRTFVAEANHLRDMYAFFKAVRRKGAALVWRPRARWEAGMLQRVCGDLGLTLAVDPLLVDKTPGPIQYFRLEPPRETRYSEAALKEVARRCREKPSYVFFAGRTGLSDARRYLEARGAL